MFALVAVERMGVAPDRLLLGAESLFCTCRSNRAEVSVMNAACYAALAVHVYV